jgi:enolase
MASNVDSFIKCLLCKLTNEKPIGGKILLIAENSRHLPPLFQLCKDAIEKAGYTGKIKIGMDVAASEFYKDGKYDLDFKNPNSSPDDWLSSDKLGDMYKGFINDAPVVSIEDPFDQVFFCSLSLLSVIMCKSVTTVI